ncbi:alpha-glucuronidase family glycosyl hydrolase [Shouchella patagoniensis]|uniref:alpha-glucuronidase family glycosyl hydrolase n=1 Tax=Shouchella patagoniensis TaxID=228576 RepID=UPI0009955FB8|nr:alpha-glucuronidase family glycosyl hydrolase [Shouchella patagoniensis]
MAYDSGWLPSLKSNKELRTLVVQLPGSKKNTIETILRTYMVYLFEELEVKRNDRTDAELTIATFEDLGETPVNDLGGEGYLIEKRDHHTTIKAETEQGLMYGLFFLMKQLQLGNKLHTIDAFERPASPIRMINHWDNMDGTVERGYAGRSLFFENNAFIHDEERITAYAEMLASVGINALTMNNVNVHEVETYLIDESLLPDVAKHAAIFKKYGISLYLSINYASPIVLGKLDSADPLDKAVISWWKKQAEIIYRHVPELGGFVVKADSEHRPGPFTYGRTHADGANMLAAAITPFGGTVFWRCFVYDCLQDWRDRTTDRARAAYDHFAKLDGQFAENVILQIKSGPMDFQVREPVTPLFGALKQTNHVIEFQIAQEYTGQQIDVCFLPPMWQEILEFDTHAKGEGTTVAKIVTGNVYKPLRMGMTAVVNTGRDSNWTGHTFAQANLYSYGMMAWNPEVDVERLSSDWTKQTFPQVPEKTIQFIEEVLRESWEVYESYTAPLGVGWMVNTGHHYGPDVNGYEYSPWGTYHFSDRDGMGVDRTDSGSGYYRQYEPEVQTIYGERESCPDELLLFFHHVPYRHRLKSGKTVIQHIYDSHFAGVEKVEQWANEWSTFKETVPKHQADHIEAKFDAQLKNAKEWRDRINTYYYRMSGIEDSKGRTIYK